jgi:hypothetical protein
MLRYVEFTELFYHILDPQTLCNLENNIAHYAALAGKVNK